MKILEAKSYTHSLCTYNTVLRQSCPGNKHSVIGLRNIWEAMRGEGDVARKT